MKTGIETITQQMPAAATAEAVTPIQAAMAAPVVEPTARKWYFGYMMDGVLLLLSWLIPAALWNFGDDAYFMLGLLLMGGLFTALAYRSVRRVPGWAQPQESVSRSRRIKNLAVSVFMAFLASFVCDLGALIVVLLMLGLYNALAYRSVKFEKLAASVFFAFLGYIFLFNVFLTHWEMAHWNSAGQTAEQFAASHKGREYELIRQLTAFKDQVPTVELLNFSGFNGGWHIFGNIGPHNGYFTSFVANLSVLMALLFLVGAVLVLGPEAKAGSREGFYLIWRRLKPGCLPLMALLAMVFLTSFIAYSVLSTLNFRSGFKSVEWDYYDSWVRVPSSGDKTVAAFEKWAEREGYATGDRLQWNLMAVPKGNKLGDVRLAQAWKPSLFDRWRMTWHGLERVGFHFVLQTVSSDEPVETQATIFFGSGPGDVPLKGSKRQQDLKTALHDLKSALERAANGSGSGNSTNVSPTVGAPVTAPLKSEQPIFYTFAGITHFVRGPDGPQLLPSFAQELGLNALQGEAVNKIIPKYYAEFVALERQHTEFKKDTNGHVHITISPFMEETFQLAERMVAEIRGVIGQDIVHPRLPGNLMGFGLFRHCGQTTVTAELWKESGIYCLEETHGQHGPYFYPDGKSSGQSKLSRSSSNKDWKQAFPEEYWIYWTEK